MMANGHQSGDLQSYRKEAERVLALRHDLEARVAKAAESGDLETARKALDELTLATKNLEVRREKLSQVDLFLAKYGVIVHNKHTISFVIPCDSSRHEMLSEAVDIVKSQALLVHKPREITLISAELLDRWSTDPRFTARPSTQARLCIQGYVHRTYGENLREYRLRVKGLQMPSQSDLAVAFAAGFVATGESIFGCDWLLTFESKLNGGQRGWSLNTRARGGSLRYSERLGLHPTLESYNEAASAIVPIESVLPGERAPALQRAARFFRRIIGVRE